LGILIDVSHLSVQGFWELTELSDRPFIASHSNVLELCGHRRNLNEQQIRTIGERGGVIGINLFPPFLSSGNDASIEHIVAHIEKVCEWGGVHAAALGSDFDGIDQKVPGLENPAQLPNLLDALSKIFSDEQIERITYRNWYDFFVRELPKTECYT
jgi:membrane dipeptidase